MNRRSFFKFLGIGAATAAVAPKVLIGQKSNIDWESTLNKLNVQNSREEIESYFLEQVALIKERLQAILPNDVQVGPEFWDHLKILQERQGQLGLKDIQSLKKVKRNA